MKSMRVKQACCIFLIGIGGLMFPLLQAGASALPALSLDEIIGKVEDRYDVADFTALFFQTSTLKAMDVRDTAGGKLLVKRPGNMRWEYETPDRQIIITDGDRLWIYRPDDNQVMVGKSPAFFGEGKGAGFLSDFKRVRTGFTISLEDDSGKGVYVLKLIPKKPTQDLARILLAVSPDTFEVKAVVTYNAYDDETLIELKDYRYNVSLDDNLFRFDIPDGADVVNLDQ